MTTLRSIRTVYDAIRDDIGELVTRRPLPNDRIRQLDPFLFLNHHGPQVYPPHNRGLPFGPHPHRGFETVTFILEGSLAHRDTGGHESVIHAGGVQWMTAGRGLEHSEISPDDFLEHGGPLEILQLWINLPSALKMVEPRYVGLQKDQLPSFPSGRGASIVPVSGLWDGRRSPIESLTGVHMSIVSLESGGSLELPAPGGRNVFLYAVRGGVRVAGQSLRAFQLAGVADDGDTIAIEAPERSLLLFGHAAPLREPVVAHGPFVMNTREQIFEAIRDYEAGRFGPRE